MKKKKLNLENLRVESFVTSMENKMQRTVKGGSTFLCMSVSLVSISITLTRTLPREN